MFEVLLFIEIAFIFCFLKKRDNCASLPNISHTPSASSIQNCIEHFISIFPLFNLKIHPKILFHPLLSQFSSIFHPPLWFFLYSDYVELNREEMGSSHFDIIPTLCPKLSPIYVALFHFTCTSSTLLQLHPTLWPLYLSIFIGRITLHNYGTKICIIMNKNALKIPNIMALMQLRNSGIIRLPTFWHHFIHFTHLFSSYSFVFAPFISYY